MAVDLALLREAARTGSATVRTYGWQRPTVSFGRHERVQGCWDLDALRRDGFAVVRRPTGGRALLHLHDITWSVTLRVPRGVPWRAVYEAVNAHLLAALRAVDVPAQLHAGPDPAAAPAGATCFVAPAPGEVVVDGAKLGGSSVWREGEGYLQHGSLLLLDRQALLDRYRLHSSSANAPSEAPSGTSEPTGAGTPITTIAQWLPNVARRHRRRRIEASLHRTWLPPHSAPRAVAPLQHARSGTLRELARHIARDIAAPDWLWRR